MAWTVPPTFTNATLTAAALNATLRDNMNETMPAKAVLADPGSYFVTTAPNQIGLRTIVEANITTTETRTSTSYGDLATPGPAVTAVTGTKAIIVVTAQFANNTTGSFSLMSYTVSGATSLVASDDYALAIQSGGSSQHLAFSHVSHQNLNAGTNTFTAKYRVTSGTGTWLRRRILVFPF